MDKWTVRRMEMDGGTAMKLGEAGFVWKNIELVDEARWRDCKKVRRWMGTVV